MRISSNFDSGNIEVVSLESAKDIQLNIKKDKDSDFYQWFHFKLETSAGEEHQFSILNEIFRRCVKLKKCREFSG